MYELKIIPTIMSDYPVIQNMARFYVYDLSRYCGFISDDWQIPADGLYESFDFKEYFESVDREAFMLKVGNELAGFVLLNKSGVDPKTNWNMGEFFVLAKFQGKGLGGRAAAQMFQDHPGLWEVSVIPENQAALLFWRKTIREYTSHHYREEIKIIDYDQHQKKRIIFTFESKKGLLK